MEPNSSEVALTRSDDGTGRTPSPVPLEPVHDDTNHSGNSSFDSNRVLGDSVCSTKEATHASPSLNIAAGAGGADDTAVVKDVAPVEGGGGPAATTTALPLRFVRASLTAYRRRAELLRELIAYVPFLLLFVFYAVYDLNMENRYWMNLQVGGNLFSGQLATKEAIWALRPGEVEGYHVVMSFSNIRNVDEWHAWLQSTVVPELWDTGADRAENQTSNFSSRWIVGGNRPLGSVRVRVLRVRGDACDLNEDALNASAASDVTFLQPFLPATASGSCYPPFAERFINGSDLVLDNASVPRRASISTMPYRACDIPGNKDWGLHGTYPCGGNVFDVPFSLSMDEALSEVQRLRNSFQTWQGFGAVDESMVATRLLVVEFFTYTSALNMFSSYKCFAEITVGGRMMTYVRANNFYLWTTNRTGYTVYFAAFFAAVVVYAAALVRQTLRAHRIGEAWETCYCSGWYFLDVTNVLLFFAAIVVRILWIAQGASTAVQVWYPTLDERDAYPQPLETIVFLHQLETFFTATSMVLCFLKLTQFTILSRSMGVAVDTLQRAKDSLLSVLALFLLIVLAYSVAGTVVFGPYVPDDYGSVAKSFASLLQLLVGDFDYEALRVVNAAIAGLFFWSFVILGLFLMLSFVVGMLASLFDDQRARCDEHRKARQARLASIHGVSVPFSGCRAFMAALAHLKAAPRDAMRQWRVRFRNWLRAPKHLRRMERAVVHALAVGYTAPSPSATLSAVAPNTASATRRNRRQLVTEADMASMVKAHSGKGAKGPLLAAYWAAAVEEFTFDKDACEEAAVDDVVEGMKASVDRVLCDLFGLTHAASASTSGGREGRPKTYAEQKHHQASDFLWRGIEAAAAGRDDRGVPDDGEGEHQGPRRRADAGDSCALDNAAAAQEALQMRDVLLHETAICEHVSALSRMVHRLEVSVLRTASELSKLDGAPRNEPF